MANTCYEQRTREMPHDAVHEQQTARKEGYGETRQGMMVARVGTETRQHTPIEAYARRTHRGVREEFMTNRWRSDRAQRTLNPLLWKEFSKRCFLPTNLSEENLLFYLLNPMISILRPSWTLWITWIKPKTDIKTRSVYGVTSNV